MTIDEGMEALKRGIIDADYWNHVVDLELYKLFPLKIPDYPSYVYPDELDLPASSRSIVIREGINSYKDLIPFRDIPPEYTKTEDECDHDCCDEFLEGYICLKCGKWFTYEDDVTGKYKKRLQEKLKIYEEDKKKWKQIHDHLTNES